MFSNSRASSEKPSVIYDLHIRVISLKRLAAMQVWNNMQTTPVCWMPSYIRYTARSMGLLYIEHKLVFAVPLLMPQLIQVLNFLISWLPQRFCTAVMLLGTFSASFTFTNASSHSHGLNPCGSEGHVYFKLFLTIKALYVNLWCWFLLRKIIYFFSIHLTIISSSYDNLVLPKVPAKVWKHGNVSTFKSIQSDGTKKLEQSDDYMGCNQSPSLSRRENNDDDNIIIFTVQCQNLLFAPCFKVKLWANFFF